MIKAVIIEDEQKSREVLKKLLEKNCSEIEIVGMAESVQQGIELVRALQPELLFLDIMMPDGSGFDLLEKISDHKFDVIFTTATDKFAIKAIKYSAMDYLLKPIDAEELSNAVKKFLERKNNSSLEKNFRFLLENIKQKDEQYSKISLPTGNAYEIVLVSDIIRCEAYDNYTNFFLTGGRKFLASGTMKHYEDLLPEKKFIRVHHSHLINMNQVARFLKEDSGYAVMSDGSKVEISRRKREDFLKLLNQLP